MNLYQKIKRRTFEIIEKGQPGDIPSKIFDVAILALICVNVVSVFVETFDISREWRRGLFYLELVSVIIFTVEYVCRVWTADFLYPEKSPFRARVSYMLSFMALVDFFAILPFYIPFLIHVDLRILRVLRLVRLFRLLKVNRYTAALHTVAEVMRTKASQLISSIFVIFLMILISSVLIYTVESPAQPEVFKNALSGLWWSIATFTFVWMGDVYPITAAGKILCGVMAVLGVALVAVPTGIISSGFMEQSDIEKDEKADRDDPKHFCPYCGHKLD